MMVNYGEMSDFEINGYVESINCGFDWFEFVDGKELIRGSGKGSPGFTETMPLDYCNNPDDAWPIIIEHKISVRNISGDLWECASPDGMKADYSSRPLRSSMVVFLLMQEDKNG